MVLEPKIEQMAQLPVLGLTHDHRRLLVECEQAGPRHLPTGIGRPTCVVGLHIPREKCEVMVVERGHAGDLPGVVVAQKAVVARVPILVVDQRVEYDHGAHVGKRRLAHLLGDREVQG